MYIYLSKILPLMLLPIGIVFELSFLALLLMWRGKRKTSAVFLLAAMLVLWVSSMQVVADKLLGRLERQYPALAMSAIPVGDCVVVLGGAVKPVVWPRVDVDFSEAADRVYKTAMLYRARRARVVIVAGGNQPWSPVGDTEAVAIRSLLVDLGVPASAIRLDEASRNTRENALNARVLIEEAGCRKPLLVTSAAHMPRSVATFKRLGMDVFPVSTDVRVVTAPEPALVYYLPSADALQMSTDAMREWMGQMIYQWRGWN